MVELLAGRKVGMWAVLMAALSDLRKAKLSADKRAAKKVEK